MEKQGSRIDQVDLDSSPKSEAAIEGTTVPSHDELFQEFESMLYINPTAPKYYNSIDFVKTIKFLKMSFVIDFLFSFFNFSNVFIQEGSVGNNQGV